LYCSYSRSCSRSVLSCHSYSFSPRSASLNGSESGGGLSPRGFFVCSGPGDPKWTGHGNTANGTFALLYNTVGPFNTAIGDGALVNNTIGFGNTGVGLAALARNTGGSDNIAVGFGAGGNLTNGSDNIDIGNAGVAGESATIRIGATQTKTFIAGIREVTTGIADVIPVLIDSAGQLGTTSSSRRFKKEIKPMDKTSEAILALEPVTFHYKSDKTNRPEFGLIAEDVARVNPDLVVRDKNGEVYTVRYEPINAMVLNEFLKAHRKVQDQERRIQEQEVTIAQLKKEVETLVGHVREHHSKIQRVID
jgi:hypothetical protein